MVKLPRAPLNVSKPVGRGRKFQRPFGAKYLSMSVGRGLRIPTTNACVRSKAVSLTFGRGSRKRLPLHARINAQGISCEQRSRLVPTNHIRSGRRCPYIPRPNTEDDNEAKLKASSFMCQFLSGSLGIPLSMRFSGAVAVYSRSSFSERRAQQVSVAPLR